MQLKSIAFTLAYVSCIAAAPVESDSSSPLSGYVEVGREPAVKSDGSIVYYGAGKTARAEVDTIETRSACTPQTVKCDKKFSARNELCDSLVTELYGDSSILVLPSTTQICYEGAAAETNPYCCVSWHNKIPGLVKGDLAPIADNMLQTCTESGIGGKTYNVKVRGTCTGVCLSNRGTHC